jgi:hypothetical protein
MRFLSSRLVIPSDDDDEDDDCRRDTLAEMHDAASAALCERR